MHIFIFFSILITLAAVFAYINVRFFKLPLGILFITMGAIISLALMTAGHLFPSFTQLIKQKLSSIDFSEDYTEKFWEITDEILNAILFILIGLQLVIISFQFNLLIIGLIMAILLILVRYISLWLPAFSFFFKKDLKDKTLEIMTWGGLRGGISIALALSLPQSMYKEFFVPVTFVIVLFSIIVQGFTMKWFVKKLS